MFEYGLPNIPQILSSLPYDFIYLNSENGNIYTYKGTQLNS